MDALELLRHRLRGTRARSLTEAGHSAPSSGQLWSLLNAALSNSGIPQFDASVVRAFYGLSGYPADLTSSSSIGLVGDIGQSGSATPMSRSSLSARRKLAKELTISSLPQEFQRDFETNAEPDPMMDRELHRMFAKFRLDEDDVSKVLGAAMYSAFDWVDEARSAAALQSALAAWGHKNDTSIGITKSRVSYRQEHRNAAKAVMSICLWRIVSDNELLETCRTGTPAAVWLALPDLASELPLVAELASGARVDRDMDPVDLLKLVGDVHHQRDSSGRLAALATDMFRSGRARDLLGADEGPTIWMLGYGLGGSGSWAVVELARWYACERPLDWRTISLLSWSAHVASLHLHDSLAWQMTTLAKRWAEDIHGDDGRRFQLKMFNIELIRAGCRVREADRLAAHAPVRAAESLQRANQCLSLARDALVIANPDGTDAEVSLPLGLRRIEILVVAADLRELGRPVEGLNNERRRARRLLDQAWVTFEERAGVDEGNDAMYEQRLRRLEEHLSSG